MSLLIKNGYILTLDKQESVYTPGDVLIEGDRITQIGKKIESDDIDCVIDATDKLVMPGLVVSHAHSDENLFKGAYDNLPLELWMLYSYTPLSYGPMAERLIYLRTLLSAMEMLKDGVTTVQDDVSEWPRVTIEGMNTVFQAYKDLGMRASITANLSDKTYQQKIPYLKDVLPANIIQALTNAPGWTADELLSICHTVIQNWHGHEGRLNFVVAPSGPQRCSDEFLIRLNELSLQYNLPIHTHVLETKTQMVTGHEYYGKSIVEHLHEIGLLHDRTTLIHAIWLTDQDIALMGEAKCTAVHNPASNLKLGSGIMPLRKLLDAGVNVCLGVDGMSSNDSQSIWEAMKLTALLHKISHPDYRFWPTSAEVLRMATYGGARSALLHNHIGILAEGYKADITIINLNTINFTPLNDVKNQLVYCEEGSSVDSVIVNGQLLVQHGRIRTIDEAEILRELRTYMQDFWKAFAEAKTWAERLFPYVDQVYRKIASTPSGVNRWAGNERDWIVR